MGVQDWWMTWCISLYADQYQKLIQALSGYCQCWSAFVQWEINHRLLEHGEIDGFHDSYQFCTEHAAELKRTNLSIRILRMIMTHGCWYIQHNAAQIKNAIKNHKTKTATSDLMKILPHVVPVNRGFDPMNPSICFYHTDPCRYGKTIMLKMPKLYRIRLPVLYTVPEGTLCTKYYVRPYGKMKHVDKCQIFVGALCKTPTDGYERLIRKEKL